MSAEPFKSEFQKLLKTSEPAWLSENRKKAFEKFEATGIPTTANEEWVHTNPAAIAKQTYETSVVGYKKTHEKLPEGVLVLTMAEAMKKEPEKIKALIAKQKKSEDAFTALNESLFQDGFYIFVPKGVVVTEPIELTFRTETNGHALLSSPRNIIVAEEGSEVSVIETFESSGESPAFVNSYTQIFAGENASVRHVKIQNEAYQTFHVGTVATLQERNSHFNSTAIHLGGKLVRSNTNTEFTSEGAECMLNGLFITSGDQHTDNHTLIDHAQPHCTSRELYKGIVTDRSRGVFDGKIIVRPNAQKTNARQTSRNLLLSEDALIDTTPRLEIFADDVKCAHGATIGSLDENALFYFQSRGIDALTAKRMLTYAFANEIVNEIPQQSLRERIAKQVEIRLQEVNR